VVGAAEGMTVVPLCRVNFKNVMARCTKGRVNDANPPGERHESPDER
jgi:hypothetical protein